MYQITVIPPPIIFLFYMFRQTLHNKTYLPISVLSSTLPQQRVLWHHSARTESFNTRSGCALLQSSEERCNRVIPPQVPSATTSPTTSLATPTGLDILHLKWLIVNDLLWKQKLRSDHKQLRLFAKQIKTWNVFQKLFYNRRSDP